MNANKSPNNQIIYALVGIIVLVVVVAAGMAFWPKNDNQQVVANTSKSSISSQIGDSNSVNSTPASSSQSANNSTQTTTEKGVYADYSQDMLQKAAGKNVVLFFNAAWCPTCRSTVKNINSQMDQIPSDLVILSTDFDKEISLRQKYGVTMQHTFVKVDQNGNLLKKASGLSNVQAINDFASAN